MAQQWLDLAPQPQESLQAYVHRLRTQRQWSQAQLSQVAGVHRQTIGKIESGMTQRLNQRARSGLALALSIPVEYFDAVCGGTPVVPLVQLKVCPRCWIPGNAPDPMWTDLRSHYCFACGTALLSRCPHCQKPIGSLEFRFCPYCGTAYKSHAVLGNSDVR